MFELLIALGAGLVSFLSPCVLPLIPGYISYISGSSLNELIEKKNVNLPEPRMGTGGTKPVSNYKLEESKKFTVAPAYNKGGYQVISKTNIKDIGR